MHAQLSYICVGAFFEVERKSKTECHLKQKKEVIISSKKTGMTVKRYEIWAV